RSHVRLQVLKTPRTIITGIDSDVFGQRRVIVIVFRGQPTVNVAIQVPATVEASVPASHWVVVQPDVLPQDAKHPLFKNFAEQGSDGAMVVVAPDKVDIAALDPVAVAGGLVQTAHAEIAKDPQDVIDADPRIDGLQQGLVMALQGFLADSPG